MAQKSWKFVKLDHIFLGTYFKNSLFVQVDIETKSFFFLEINVVKLVIIKFTFYREYSEHAEIEFNTNGTVTGSPKQPLEFVPELSVGTEEDIFFLPNVALLVSIYVEYIDFVLNFATITCANAFYFIICL